jgi:hypothetical protein
MGLDMYLTAKQYLWNHKEEEQHLRKEIAKVLGVTAYDAKSVSFDVMYWRKCNAIHAWFVENVQDGDDDCKEYWVDSAQLDELVALCNEALANRDADVLEPVEGFFFGSTERDEYYWQSLTETRDRLSELLTNPASVNWDFYYQSSW